MISPSIFYLSDKFLPVQSQLMLEEVERFRLQEHIDNVHLERIMVIFDFDTEILFLFAKHLLN